MNDSREPDEWLDADRTDRLLSGQDVPGSDRRIAELARLLATVADGLPVGRPEDEGAALAAFRYERDHPSCRMARTRVRMARSAKVLAGSLAAVLAVGGVAIAAQQGVLPKPFAPGHRTSTPAAPGPALRSSPSGSAPGHAATSGAPASGTASAPPPSARRLPHPAGHGGAPADPGMKGLCLAYAEAARHGKPLDPHSRARLEAAAGGRDKVDAYCAVWITLTSAGPSAPVVGGPPLTGPPSLPVTPSLSPIPQVPVAPSASVTPAPTASDSALPTASATFSASAAPSVGATIPPAAVHAPAPSPPAPPRPTATGPAAAPR